MANPSRGNFKDKAEETLATAGQAASDVKHKAQEGAHNVLHKAGEVASDVAHKAGEMATSAAKTVGSTAANVASTVGHKADDAASAVGQGMSSLAGTIREKAPQSGVLGSAASTVASSLQSGGDYLKEHGLSGAWDDLTALVRRHPMPAVLIGFGVGFLLSRATSRG
jgi:hypothetical protein